MLCWSLHSLGDDSGVKSTVKANLIDYNNEVKPLLNKYCYNCHDKEKAKGDVRLDNIDPNMLTGKDVHIWEEALELLNVGEMPPEDKKQPTLKEREVITKWLNNEFLKAIALKKKLGGHTNIRRMTRYELAYTLEDLFGLRATNLVSKLPEESNSADTGLKNNGSILGIGGPQLSAYFDTIVNTVNKLNRCLTDKKMVEVDGVKQNLTGYVKPKKPGRGKGIYSVNVEKFKKGMVIKGAQGKNAVYGEFLVQIPNPPKEGKFRLTFKAGSTNEALMADVHVGYLLSLNNFRHVEKRFLKSEKIDARIDSPKTYTIEGYLDDLPFGAEPDGEGADLIFWIKNNSKDESSRIYLESCVFTGPVNTDMRESVFISSKNKDNKTLYFKELLTSFLRKAFRRPATQYEIETYNKIYNTHLKSKDEIYSLLKTFEIILCSPKFYYLGKPSVSVKQKTNNGDVVNDYGLAEKLSYFLWCSQPDEELNELAAKGELHKPETLKLQIKRMIKSEKSKRLVEHFSEQWLDIKKLFNVAVSNDFYPKYSENMSRHMRQETIESVNEVFRGGVSALNLLSSDHTFLNEELAEHYGIEKVNGNHFRKVQLKPEHNRGGLLTQGTFLVGNSDGENSHVILRAVWLNDRILHDPPPPPPKTVPPLDDTVPGFEKMTLTEKLVVHRNSDSCRNCHNKIDPWGLPFESYDASGAWRSRVLVKPASKKVKKQEVKPESPKVKKQREAKAEKAKKEKNVKRARQASVYGEVETATTLPTGQKINDMKELKSYLVEEKKEQFAKSLTERLLAYALSRDMAFYDRELVNGINKKFINSGFLLSVLIEEIVLSEEFQQSVRR